MTKSPENIWVFDSDRDNLDNWRNADALNYAWFGFATPEIRERYRESGNRLPSAAKFLELDMQLELKTQIAKGRFLAFGIQIAPILKDDPEQIPAICFEAHEVKIDWQNDSLSGFGRAFHDVRVCLPAEARPKSTPSTLPIAVVRKGGGRPSQYANAKEVFEILFCERRYSNLPASRLLGPFNHSFVARFGATDIKIAPISERSLRNHLDRYRKELAKIGK